MMESEHIRSLPSDVKRSSVLVAWTPRKWNIKDVIQDAIYRDRALDGYERVQQRALEELEASKTKENAEIQADIDRYVTEQRAKIQANNEVIAREKERVTGWRLKKQQEEKKIAETVGYFVSENPITTGELKTVSPFGFDRFQERAKVLNGRTIMWARLSRVIRSFVGFFISVAEDPELILQQNIRDMNDQVPRMNESIAMVKANVTLLEKEEAKYKEQITPT
jgi:hypothetical protein